jgi:hypothetical protein
MIGENRFNRRSQTRIWCVTPNYEYEGRLGRKGGGTFIQGRRFRGSQNRRGGEKMGRGLLLWLIGIPIPIILLIWLFGGLHG